MSTDTLTPTRDTQSLAQGGWRIDPTRSSVEFRAPTLWGLTNVTGRFERYQGTLDLHQTPATQRAGLLHRRRSSSDSTASA
jgi:polyisoprenoid-binding protein YceI